MRDIYFKLLSRVARIRKRYLLAAVLLAVGAFGSAGSLTDTISQIVDLLLQHEQSREEKIDATDSDDMSFFARSS